MWVVMSQVHRPVRRNPHDITFAAIKMIVSDEAACLTFFKAIRFPSGLTCDSCGADEAEGAHFTHHRSRPGLYTCASCRRQFSISSGTAMHRTRFPLGQWLRAIWFLASSSKGISARKLGEMLGLSYKGPLGLALSRNAPLRPGDCDPAVAPVLRDRPLQQVHPSGGRSRGARAHGREGHPRCPTSADAALPGGVPARELHEQPGQRLRGQGAGFVPGRDHPPPAADDQLRRGLVLARARLHDVGPAARPGHPGRDPEAGPLHHARRAGSAPQAALSSDEPQHRRSR